MQSTSLVWFKGAIPKHSFICWLAILNRLSTRDRQQKSSPLIDKLCPFCGVEESREHLFFDCSFSSQVWKEVVLKFAKLRGDLLSWSSVVSWG